MKSFGILIVTLFAAISLVAIPPASAQSTLDIDEQRAETLKKMESVIPDPVQLREIAKTTFSKSLSDQKVDVLKSLAKRSNSYANMVNFIKDEYDDFLRKNIATISLLRKCPHPYGDMNKS